MCIILDGGATNKGLHLFMSSIQTFFFFLLPCNYGFLPPFELNGRRIFVLFFKVKKKLFFPKRSLPNTETEIR